ncbi:protein DEK-like [Diabrotica virgifera virgifera]|uniref:Uncharacterized protein n=1 Tax=Diabrotica virgifera virgifera TaxID=50390 RepID=A0ABM5KY65_DIAVI|nr:protein DEK-like [Diabrotica virgifera virgifera]
MAHSLPIYEGSRKVGPNPFQEISSDTEGYSSVDDAKSEKDGFKLPRSERKKEKSKKKREETKKGGEEPKKDGKKPEVEPMVEDEAVQANRGTTKRAKESDSEDKEDKKEKIKKKNGNEDTSTLIEMLKKMLADQEVKNEQLTIENERLKYQMMEMSKKMDAMMELMKQSKQPTQDRQAVLPTALKAVLRNETYQLTLKTQLQH